jgi:hypothetical protein
MVHGLGLELVHQDPCFATYALEVSSMTPAKRAAPSSGPVALMITG